MAKKPVTLSTKYSETKKAFKVFEKNQRSYYKDAREVAAKIYEFCVEAKNDPKKFDALAKKHKVTTRADASPFTAPIKLVVGQRSVVDGQDETRASSQLVNTYANVCLYADYRDVSPKDFRKWLLDENQGGGGGSLSRCRELAKMYQVTPDGKNYKYKPAPDLNVKPPQFSLGPTQQPAQPNQPQSKPGQPAPPTKPYVPVSSLVPVQQMLLLPEELRKAIAKATRGITNTITLYEGKFTGFQSTPKHNISYSDVVVHGENISYYGNKYHGHKWITAHKNLLSPKPVMFNFEADVERYLRNINNLSKRVGIDFKDGKRFVKFCRYQLQATDMATLKVQIPSATFNLHFWDFDDRTVDGWITAKTEKTTQSLNIDANNLRKIVNKLNDTVEVSYMIAEKIFVFTNLIDVQDETIRLKYMLLTHPD